MNVTFHALFREIAGVKASSESMEEGSKVGDLVQKLSERYGREFKEILGSKGEINPSVFVVHNGERIHNFDIPLKDGDDIVLAVPISGG